MSSLYDILAKQKNNDNVAVFYGDKSITYREFNDNVCRAAAYFKGLQVKQGDVVTVALPNVPAALYVLYALNALGAVQNNVHPLTPTNDVIRTAKATQSVLIVTLATAYKANKENIAHSGERFVFVNPVYDDGIIKRNLFYVKFGIIHETDKLKNFERFRDAKPLYEFPKKDSGATSFYLHSGGTTDVPKIIELSDDSINNLVAKSDDIITSQRKGKSMLAVLPTFHGFGLAMGIHNSVYWEMKIALMMKYKPIKLIKWINENKVNFILGVPILYQKLMDEKSFSTASLKNLDYAFVGGDNIPPTLIDKFNKTMEEHGSSCKMCEGYGLTETVTVNCVNTKENYRICSVGKPLRGLSVYVADENGNEAVPGEVGEVFVTGDTVMNGYYRDENATNATIVDIRGVKYVKTGDLGYLDADGFLFLKGRKKRVFKMSGINVYPGEVEKIATDREEISSAALEFFAEPVPHTVLFVIKEQGTITPDEEISKKVYLDLNDRVLKYSIPKKIVFLPEFPKTKIGKIDHEALKKAHASD